MKSMFPGYYRPKQEEFAERFKTCVFCFDTNSLLNLYRFTPESRDNLLKVLRHDKIKDRIWLPHRVGFEYQRRRTDVLLGQLGLVGDAEKIIEKAITELDKLCRSSMFAVNALVDPIKADLEAVKAKLHPKKQAKPDLLEGDTIFDALTELFEGKVGKPYDKEQEKSVHKKGKDRYEAKVPPGYEDRSKDPNDTDQYGDLILWLQILDYAKGQDRPIILVTDDAKEDWWREIRGETLGPRVELIEEFARETSGKWFYMYSTEQFLKHAKEHLAAPVTQEAIKEAEEIKKHDAQEEKIRSAGVNISEALEALKRGDERALAAAATAIERTGGPHIPPPYTSLREALSSSNVALAGLTLPSDEVRRALSQLTFPGDEVRQALAGLKFPGDEVRQALAGLKFPGDEVRQALAGLKFPGDEVRQALAGLKFSGDEVRQVLAGLKFPGDEVRQVLAGLKFPGDEVRRALAGLKEASDVLRRAGVTPQTKQTDQPPAPEPPEPDGDTSG